MVENEIRILDLNIFKQYEKEINIVKQFLKTFGKEIGWHYYLDIAWTLNKISCLKHGSIILDAGAGSGIIQFILAEAGYNVISVDLTERNFSRKITKRFNNNIFYLNKPKTIKTEYSEHLESEYKNKLNVKNIISNIKNNLKKNKHSYGFDNIKKYKTQKSDSKGLDNIANFKNCIGPRHGA